jgi:hypothetical protein
MAKALQCPTCGTKKRIDALAGGASFRCEQCGQVLKVPPGLEAPPKPSSPKAGTPKAGTPKAGTPKAGAVAPRQPATSGGAPPPAPRRRSRPTMTAGGVAAGAGGTAVLSSAPSPGAAPPVISPGAVPARGPVPNSPGGNRADRDRAGRESLPLPLRVLAWLVALPLGLAIVGLPARKAGYLSSQKLLDVIVKSDMSRFVPIVVIIVLWALVSAALVTLFVEGGRRLMARRHDKRTSRAGGVPVGAAPGRGARGARPSGANVRS